MDFKRVSEIISDVLSESDDMSKAEFYSAIGTIMKMYSIKNDITMIDLLSEFIAGILEAEAVFGSKNFSNILSAIRDKIESDK